MPKEIRSANKAVIIENGKLLVLKKKYKLGFFYTLPGGGQEHGETAEEGLVRECIEEISIPVKPKRVLFIRDYIAKNHEIEEDIIEGVHQLELMFLCEIVSGTPANGSLTDNGQISVEWIDLSDLDNCLLYPAAMKKYLKNINALRETIYLGDVN